MDTNPIFTQYKHLFASEASMMCSVPAGWETLVRNLIEDLLVVNPEFQILQIKEKFAGLRFYSEESHYPDRLTHEVSQLLVHKAEGMSYTRCMTCGRGPASLSKDRSHIVTRCEAHACAESGTGTSPQVYGLLRSGPYLPSSETERLDMLLPRHPNLGRELVYRIEEALQGRQTFVDLNTKTVKHHLAEIEVLGQLLRDLGQRN